jgi:sigma-B regulation protein RsbU (phosphoserine phosphatase)
METTKPRVLVVDDHADILEALRLLLKGGGYLADTALTPRLALELAAANTHDAVLIDMNYDRDTTSGEEGLALLQALRAQRPETPVIAMTAWGSIELAVEAMRRGAADFIPKPWENQRVHEAIQRQSHRREEMTLARRVQRRLLPPSRGTGPGLEYDCVFRPAGDLGGDLWDVFATSTGTAFMLGDVAGKGTGAALMMASLQATIRGNEDLACEPARLATRVNRLFFRSTAPEHFATVFLGHYDPRTRLLRYVNCGHPAPVLLRGDTAERLDCTCLVLGAFEHAEAEERTIAIESGDRLILFSDGVSEATRQGEVHGDDDRWVVDYVRRLATSPGLAESLAMAAVSDDDVSVLDLRFQ